MIATVLEVLSADPDIPLDTYHLERALRLIPMERGRWLYCWTELGTQQVGESRSLLATRMLQQVDPYP